MLTKLRTITAYEIKQAAKLIAVIIIIGVSAAFGTIYMLNAGKLITRPLDPNLLSESNPAARKTQIEKATDATVVIKSLEGYEFKGVSVNLQNCRSRNYKATVYMSEKDIAKLSVGDVVTVRGDIKYVYNQSMGTHTIMIGDPLAVPPMAFNAKLIKK